MTNALSVVNNKAALMSALETTESALASASGSSTFLKMTKGGLWIYGAEEIEVEEGSKWAINPMSIKIGYVCWHQSKLIGEQLRPFYEPAITLADLPQLQGQWTQQISVGLRCMSGEDEGLELLYPTSSKGGLKALKLLIAEMRKHVQTGDIVPIVTLENDKYKHAEYGWIYNPVLTVDKWVVMDALPDASVADDEPDDDDDYDDEPVVDVIEAPKKAARKAKAVEETVIDEPEPAVQRTRRRRA